MEIIAYAKDGGERVLIGTFDSIETIHDEVEIKLEDLGLGHWINSQSLKRPIYIIFGTEEYKLIWGMDRK